jgi:hypothetical protein
MKIAVTLSKCRQTGEEEYTTYHSTKIYDTSCKLDDIIEWCKQYHGPSYKFHVNDLQFSMIEEETL